jgi:hypothetical protein
MRAAVGSGAAHGKLALCAQHRHCTAGVSKCASRGGCLEVACTPEPSKFPGTADHGAQGDGARSAGADSSEPAV